MSSHKEKVLQKMKELAEYKKFKENSVMIQLPYGMPGDSFKIHCIVSKEAVEQMNHYDELMKNELEKYNEKMKEINDLKDKLKSEKDEMKTETA